jgi:hypothetical protein
LSAAAPPFKNSEKLLSMAALNEIGDQIEYLPPTVSKNGIMLFSKNPNDLAFLGLAVTTIEFLVVLFDPSHFKHVKVSSVDKDLDEKI